MKHFDRSNWSAYDEGTRLELASSLVDVLPKGFAFHGLATYELGDQRNHIAEFTYHDLRFCLVPGDHLELGYDPRSPFLLHREHGDPHRTKLADLKKKILHGCTLLRTCHIDPMLVEAFPKKLGFNVVSASDPEFADILSKRSTNSPTEIWAKDFILRRDEHGVITMARRGTTTHEQILMDFSRQGFRLPTNDEWEYLCGAGSRAFFRWGDDYPTDRYPNDRIADAKIVEITRNWEPGQPIWDPVRGDWEWGKHRSLNAFGLEIARDPYDLEVVSVPGIYRGGDGGNATCGGACYFEGWLSLATSWYVQDPVGHEQSRDLAGFLGRRVLPVATLPSTLTNR